MFQTQPDRRAYQLEFLLQSLWPGSRSGIEGSADPTLSGPMHEHDLGVQPRLLYGRVIEGVAYTHFYRVQVENAMSTLPCVSMGHTSFSAVGARQLNTYAPGTGVYLLYSSDAWYGVILGAEPDFLVDATQALSDYVAQGSNVGLQADRLHRAPFALAEKGGVVDWSAGRPADSLPLGEWGAVSETGIRVFLDSFMAALAADESTGIWAFYLDQMLRVAGHNLQLRSFGLDSEHLDDECEFHVVERRASYPWEAMGNLRQDQGPWNMEWDAASVQNIFPWLARLEPYYDDQQGFHRLETFHGYLGSAAKKHLKTLPFGKAPYVPQRYQDKTVAPGVFEETVLLTGQLNLRSAKGIFLTKELRIPSPKQLKRPEDTKGDTRGNYLSGGTLGGGGSEHTIQDGPTVELDREEPEEPEEDEEPEEGEEIPEYEPLLKATALLDTLAYTFNYEGVVPFHYHEKDWYLPDEEEMVDASTPPPPGSPGEQPPAPPIEEGGLPGGIDTTPSEPPKPPPTLADAVPLFNSLDLEQFLEPKSFKMRVDERYGEVTYYRNGSSIALHDDGTVSITGAFGEQMLFCGGSIYLDCPGDVWVRTGKNFNVWSGYDTNIKSSNSLDMTCSGGDLRLKADRNMQLLAGMSEKGEGGILLESKARCAFHEYAPKYGEDVISSGIVLRADRSQVIGISREFVWTNNCPEVEQPGNFLIDMNQQKIVTRSWLFERHLDGAALDMFPDGVVNEWWATGATVGSPLSVNGPFRVVKGYISVEGWLYATEHIGTGNAKKCNYLVAPFTEETDLIVRSEIAQVLERIDNLRYYKRDEAYKDLEFRDGMCTAHFSFRTPPQYKTNDERCTVHEARWQQTARLADEQPAHMWVENTLTMRDGTKLQPFPGYEEWEDEEDFRTIDLGLYQTTQGYRLGRGSAYSDTPTYEIMKRATLTKNYRIIRPYASVTHELVTAPTQLSGYGVGGMGQASSY